MFTGIIETIGTVTAIEAVGDLTRLSLDAGAIVEGVKIGDSIAVNGTCLTVTVIEGERVYERSEDIRNRHLLEGVQPRGTVGAARDPDETSDDEDAAGAEDEEQEESTDDDADGEESR